MPNVATQPSLKKGMVGPPTGLAEHTVGLKLTLKKPAHRMKVRLEDLPGDFAKMPLHITADLFKSGRYKDVSAIDNQIRAYVKDNSVPFPLMKGYYLVPSDLQDKINKNLDLLIGQRGELEEAFVEDYERLKKESKESLGSLFHDAKFPPEQVLESAFIATYEYVDVTAYLKGQWKQSEEAIRKFLRDEFLTIVEGFAGTLKYTKSTRREKYLDRILSFLRTFEHRNVLGDDELESLVVRLRELFEPPDGEGLELTAESVNYAEIIETKPDLKPEIEQLARTGRSMFFGDDDATVH